MNVLQGNVLWFSRHRDFGRILVGVASEHARGFNHGICHIVKSLGRRGDCACSTLRVLGVRITWHVKRPTNSTVKRMAAARPGIGMRAPGSEQGRRGTRRVMFTIRVHAGTVVGERSST